LRPGSINPAHKIPGCKQQITPQKKKKKQKNKDKDNEFLPGDKFRPP
jgi:hypothetical protein